MSQQESAISRRDLSRPFLISFIFILGGLSAFGPLTIDMYLPSLPILTTELDTTASLTQLSLTACFIGMAVGQILIGPYSDMKGRRNPLLVSLLFYTVSSVMCMFVQSVWLLIILRLIQGMSGSAGIVISRASLRDVFSGAELTKYFSMLMLVSGLAPILAPVIGGVLLKYMSWRGIFGVLTMIGCVMFASVFFGLKETLTAERRKTGGIKEVVHTFGQLLRDKAFIGYALIQSFAMGALFAYISGSSFVLQDIYGLSPQAFSMVFAMNSIGIVLSSQITGRLAGKMNIHVLLRFGLIMAVLNATLLVISIFIDASVTIVSILLFFMMSSIGIINTTVFPLSMEEQGEQAGSASALLGLLPFVFGAIVAPIVGLGNAAISMVIVIAVCKLLAALIYVWVWRQRA